MKAGLILCLVVLIGFGWGGKVCRKEFTEGSCPKRLPTYLTLDLEYVFGYSKPWYMPITSKYGVLNIGQTINKGACIEEEDIPKLEIRIQFHAKKAIEEGVKFVYWVTAFHGKDRKTVRFHCIATGLLTMRCSCKPGKGNEQDVDCSNLNPMLAAVLEADRKLGFWICFVCTVEGQSYYHIVSKTPTLSDAAIAKIKETFAKYKDVKFDSKYFVYQNYTM